MDLSDSYKLLQNILHDMATSSDGVSTGDIVQKYQVSRRLVPKYMSILENSGVPIYVERKRYYVDSQYFTPFALTPDESEFLYLALERSLHFHSGQWRVLNRLLHKLGKYMSSPLADYLASGIAPNYVEHPGDYHFSVLAEAKRDRREVWVSYHPLNKSEPGQWLIRPFRFVSNTLSDGLYIHCQGSRDGANFIPMSLKLDRILDLKITDNQYDLMELARFQGYSETAWGVWSSDREPTQVSLRFEPRHYDRLLETIWHPTQQLSVDETGYVWFRVTVSEPQEMVPWIRSWGSGVIVEEPQELRQRIIRTLQRQLQSYGMTDTQPNAIDVRGYLWAKYDRKTGDHHLLHYHLLDVAAVALLIWERVLSDSQRNWLSTICCADASTVQRQLAFLAALHDIGKATPSFQAKARPLYDQLLDMGLPQEPIFDEPHGTLSSAILSRQMKERGLRGSSASRLASVIGGHHGEWISDTQLQSARGAIGQTKWHELQAALTEDIARTLNVDQLHLPSDIIESNVFAAFLSGFVSVCDWIGSNSTYFPFESQIHDLSDYFDNTLSQAETALSELGWFGWHADKRLSDFNRVFGFDPNSMQATAINALSEYHHRPRLVLIEYLTGGGKTELALHAADQILNLFAQAGIYVAMPTQTTSNQMFDRVRNYLEGRYPNQSVNMQLIHAQSDDQQAFQQIKAQPDREGNDSGITAEVWFQNRKRSLLAPFGVGTIDQAMMSVLQARHHFVRQYALSHKVVIGDEIHNYDAYMYTIIERLLNWLHALNSTVILLSATLSQSTRERLIAQVGASTDSMPEAPYPRMTVVDHAGTAHVHPLPTPPTRTIKLEHINDALSTLVETVIPVYAAGGCIAIVCNTVDESIDIARLLHSSPEVNPHDVILFHARFPPAWRDDIEKDVRSKFEKHGERPHRAILVATQIIEQSLDLDFDLMVSRTAPIDLLIQRVGRLHRHESRVRPTHLNEPTLILRSPVMTEEAVPDFGIDGVIYARYIMLRTWLLLDGQAQLRIPDEIDYLIQFVYDAPLAVPDVSDAYQKALNEAHDDMALNDTGSTFRGGQFCISTPDDEFLISKSSYNLPDSEKVSITTREIRRGIDIICCSEDESLPQILDRQPTKNEVHHLMRHRITVRNRRLREALEALVCPAQWQRIAQLRSARPVIFENDTFRVPNSNFTLKLTPFFGLEIMEDDA